MASFGIFAKDGHRQQEDRQEPEVTEAEARSCDQQRLQPEGCEQRSDTQMAAGARGWADAAAGRGGAHHMAGGWADAAAGGTGSGMLFNLQVKACSSGWIDHHVKNTKFKIQTFKLSVRSTVSQSLGGTRSSAHLTHSRNCPGSSASSSVASATPSLRCLENWTNCTVSRTAERRLLSTSRTRSASRV